MPRLKASALPVLNGARLVIGHVFLAVRHLEIPYIRVSKSCAEMPPTMIARRIGQERSQAWCFMKCGDFEKIGLLGRGLSMWDSSAITPVGLHDAEQLIHHDQQVGVLAFRGWRTHEPRELRDEAADHRHRRAGDENAERGAADDDKLGGLKEQDQPAAVREVSPCNGATNDEETNPDQHSDGADAVRPQFINRPKGGILEKLEGRS